MKTLKDTRISRGISQRSLAAQSGLSFGCVQRIEQKGHNWRVESLRRVAQALKFPEGGIDFFVEQYFGILPDSVLDISMRMQKDGFESWKTHLMNLIDRFRASGDGYLIQQPPFPGLDPRLQALIASTVESLCIEKNRRAPDWCRGIPSLSVPWFVAGVENLKALALVESPASFRKRNIFVLGNFLERV